MGKNINQWLARAKFWGQEETGLGVVESLAAVAILGAAIVAFVVALSTGSIAVREGEQEAMAQSLVRTQLEYIKNYPYNPEATTYPKAATPEGYDIFIEVSPIPDTDADIQKITVTIFQEEQEILTVENYKVNR